jgi:hypothetical protein
MNDLDVSQKIWHLPPFATKIDITKRKGSNQMKQIIFKYYIHETLYWQITPEDENTFKKTITCKLRFHVCYAKMWPKWKILIIVNWYLLLKYFH